MINLIKIKTFSSLKKLYQENNQAIDWEKNANKWQQIEFREYKKTCKFNNKMVDNPIKNQAKGIS